MNRKDFIELMAANGAAMATVPLLGFPESIGFHPWKENQGFSADVVIAGGGLGGCAAALAALRNNLRVTLTEETDWIGGQITQQGVPPDEHGWIETHGATRSYRDFRNAVRDYYRRHYPMTEAARTREFLNPGDATGSRRMSHEPHVALAVLQGLFAHYISSGQLTLLVNCKCTDAGVTGDEVRELKAVHRHTGKEIILSAPYFVDATELGDLLPLTGTEFVTGKESQAETGELHAPGKPNPDSHQAFTWCFAMDYVPGANHITDRPENYSYWRNFVPRMTPPYSGKLLDLRYSDPKTLEPRALGFHPKGIQTGNRLNLWNYRRIIHKKNFITGTYSGDTTVVNWPQNDYFLGNLTGEEKFAKHGERARQLSLSLFYWLQTEVPRPDGGQGWPGLRLRGDLLGTGHGLAKYPYIRESRRIKAVFTILEEHVGEANRALVAGKRSAGHAARFDDSVGIGYYHIDLHPSSGGDNYIDFNSLPFQVPLGALLPQRMKNLLPANKNIGTTHITNGCYRVHPVEWSIGEAVGMLVAYAQGKQISPHAVREKEQTLHDFQDFLQSQGIDIRWPD
ncbi:MAG: FAD-dependent oxidoreductase [Balneolales bacterium]